MKATTFAITTLLLTIGMSVAEPPFQSGSKDTGKPPSKELDEKPGNQDLGGNSGKEPGVGNGDGKGSGCGVGYGVGAFSGKCSNRKLIVRDDTTKLTRGHSSESGKPMKAKDVLDEQRRLEALLEKHKSRTRMLGKDLDNKPGNQNLGGNSGKEPGVGNGKGQGQANEQCNISMIVQK